MKITICILDFIFPLEVSGSVLVSELFMLISLESGLSDKEFELSKEGKILNLIHNKTIEEVGIKNGDLLMATQKRKSEENAATSLKVRSHLIHFNKRCLA